MFALFENPNNASQAVAELELVSSEDQAGSVVLHRGRLDQLPSSELLLFETGLARMIARFCAGGAVLGLMIGLTALAVTNGSVGLLALTTVAGALAGVLTAIFAGGSQSDPMLHDLTACLKRGGVLVSVERSSHDAAERARHILQRHDGQVVRKHLLGGRRSDEVRALRRANDGRISADFRGSE